ncbi:LADA_0H14180g1_1 [Lachancea dasiensis]|uniref:LADA_0H14180g1_1 n=1 Tax=Lachancea dasiensis TaxID=1072105 RepID=A0A1G4K4E6_9SACH|nr:LADA_0H14180g1_1 [Lachancea dasiensis]
MSPETSGSPDTGAKRGKQTPSKATLKKGGAHGTGRGKSKQVKQKDKSSLQPENNDFEFNIQDELVNGNFKARGRKTQVSINHLLEFQLPERSKETLSSGSTGRRKGRRAQEDRVHLHGESFVNANYKFLVDDRFSCAEQGLDPNVPIPGEKIVRVEVARGQSCPICLSDEIVAPRMVSCGHLFCHACMLSFFAAGEVSTPDEVTGILPRRKKYKECPLCGTFISKGKSAPAVFAHPNDSSQIPQIGHSSVFQLMCKPHGSMLALPVVLNIDPMSLGHFPSTELSELAPYSRIMKCNAYHAIDLYKKDLGDIQAQFELDKALYNESGKFPNLAIEEIKQQIQGYEEATQLQDPKKDVASNLAQLSLEVGLERYHDTNAYFFYQTAHTANTRYFLSPLDVKVLITAFGQYSRFPPILTATVEDIHHGSVVTESMIQKYKYFGHLPIGSDVAFVDVDWRSVEDVPSEVYQKFASELNTRRRKSAWKKQREDKDKRRHEKRLEREQEAFYMRENGDSPDPTMLPANSLAGQHKGPRLSEDSAKDHTSVKDNQGQHISSSSKLEKTVWGTSIPTSEEAVSKQEEDAEFAKLLESLNQQKSLEAGGKKKKKRMVTLLSSAPSRGSF